MAEAHLLISIELHRCDMLFFKPAKFTARVGIPHSFVFPPTEHTVGGGVFPPTKRPVGGGVFPPTKRPVGGGVFSPTKHTVGGGLFMAVIRARW
ncbi:MAG: hypothetical protein HZA20_00890 [Nitrospirae bacterium]|nr:hypothetical protein [Nitrospirota bacterium]